jgi:uncharacterized protein YdaU (DUF1376 family)
MKAKEKAPSFPFYPKDFLASSNVCAMSLAQKGAYVLLLSYQWLDGSIPSDLAKIARLIGVGERDIKRLWPELAPCFVSVPEHPDRLINPRLEEIRAEKNAFHEGRKKGGSKGAQSRWKNGSAIPEPSASDNSVILEPLAKNGFAFPSASASAESMPSARSQGAGESDPDGWILPARDRIIAVYPPEHLGGIDAAERAIYDAVREGRLVPDGEPVRHRTGTTVSSLCRAIANWRESDPWQRGKVHKLRTFIFDGIHLQPPPKAGAAKGLAPGTTTEHLDRARAFDEEAGL